MALKKAPVPRRPISDPRSEIRDRIAVVKKCGGYKNMRPLLSTLIAGALLITANLAPAQKIQNYGSGGFGLASTYAKLYDPATTVSFSGRITGINVASPMNGVGNSVRLVVKAKNGGSSLVELGPEWYVNNQRVKLHLKDKVVIHGSKVMLDGRGSIMASRISKGRQTLVLRDNSGRPFWNATAFAVSPASANGSSPNLWTVGTSPPTAASPALTQLAAPTATQRAQLMPYNSNRLVFANPTRMNGTINSLAVNNGQVFANVSIGTGNTRNVYLGPLWYLERQDVTISPGDVVVMDVLTPVPNPSNVFYVERLTDNANTIVLRDDTGQEIWAPYVPRTMFP